MVLPRGLAPRASAFAGRHAELLHFGSFENVRHAGAAPALAVWKTAVLAVALGKWWLLPVSHRTLLLFREALIYLSYAAMVPPRSLPLIRRALYF